MPFRPRLPLRLLVPYLRLRPPLPPVPLRRPLSFCASTAAVTATESEDDVVVSRDTLLAPHCIGRVGRSLRFGEDKEEFERNPSIAARIGRCYELLWERRWREMRGGLSQMVSELGSGSAPTLCDILLNRFNEYDSSSVVWDALANSYARAQMIHDALYILSKMSSLNMQILVSTYDSLLYGLRMTDMALELFEEMKSYGISPSEYSYSILIDGLCKQDKVGKALSFLKEAREGGAFKPLGMTFNILMSVSCNWGFIQSAKSFLCLMLKYGLNPDSSSMLHTWMLMLYCSIVVAIRAWLLVRDNSDCAKTRKNQCCAMLNCMHRSIEQTTQELRLVVTIVKVLDRKGPRLEMHLYAKHGIAPKCLI